MYLNIRVYLKIGYTDIPLKTKVNSENHENPWIHWEGHVSDRQPYILYMIIMMCTIWYTLYNQSYNHNYTNGKDVLTSCIIIYSYITIYYLKKHIYIYIHVSICVDTYIHVYIYIHSIYIYIYHLSISIIIITNPCDSPSLLQHHFLLRLRVGAVRDRGIVAIGTMAYGTSGGCRRKSMRSSGRYTDI